MKKFSVILHNEMLHWGITMNRQLAALLCFGTALFAQDSAAPNLVIKVEDALARAKQYAGQVESANSLVRQAREDTKQAKAARLPSVNAFNQFIYTEGNGTPSGVFVANDGVHIYNEQAVVHQELFALIRHGEVDRAAAAEAALRAKVEIAARGLSSTVVADYYAIVAAQRKLRNTQTSLGEARTFLDLTQKQEKGGEVARADVIKAQIDVQQRQRDVDEASINVDKAKIALGVMIFPKFSSDFNVVDDLDDKTPLPELAEARSAAAASSPDIKVATAGIKQAGYDVTVARYQWLPSFGLDFFYGIDANQLAARTSGPTPATGRSTLPDYEVTGRKNLGYAAQATLNIPIWNWGTTRSKIKQAEYKEEQAKADLSIAQKTQDSASAAAYLEAKGAERQLASLQTSASLAAESLRLTVLRYQAGEATALEVVDAQNTLNLSRNAYDDGLARYRVAVASLRVLMGTL
jgi:outer membrane protein TolC